MVNLHWRGDAPDLGSIARRFGVPPDAFDPVFGVIAVSNENEGIYTVRILADWARKIAHAPGGEGPFPEGRIAGFGPPEK